MVFDDDVKLIGLYQRYEDELEEMKKQIVSYITSETFKEDDNKNELQDVSEINLIIFFVTKINIDEFTSWHAYGNEEKEKIVGINAKFAVITLAVAIAKLKVIKVVD